MANRAGTPARRPASADPHVRQARGLARLLDTAVRIPGTDVRIGLDPLLGLIPGLGDVIGGALSGYVILLAARAGASKPVLLRMLANVAMDSLVGAVPVLGDIFDVAWKANVRNLALLERHLERPAATRTSSRAFVAVVLIAVLLLAVGAVALTVALLRWLFGYAAAG